MISKFSNIQKEELAKFVRYFISGVSAFLIDMVILHIMTFVVFEGHDKYLFEVLSWSKIVSSSVGLTASFLLNRNWAFKATNQSYRSQFVKFAGTTIFNVLFAIALYSFFNKALGVLEVDNEIRVPLSNLSTEFIKMITTYIFYKYLVFK